MAATTGSARPGTYPSLVQAFKSWRTGSISLLAFSAGVPLGLVWIAIPDWMRASGFDIKIVGLFTLAQAPWSFKLLWAPLMDRYAPPWLGRRRGWIAISQILLALLTLALAATGHRPDSPWVVGTLALAIAFAAASQDVALDAYAVEVLRREEQGVAVGARTAVYRGAMYAAGGLAITLSAWLTWPIVHALLALTFLPMLLVTLRAPEPETPPAPIASLRTAIWEPFLGFLSRHRALEILAFVFLYKIADNLASALLRPFLVDMGYSEFDRGVALATIAVFATLAGTLVGGILTSVVGLGHSLWLSGLLQIFSNVGYVWVARGDGDVPLMYAAMGFESATSGMGTGAFSVLLIRMTQKRFSATQYALFSSLFALPRIVSGPISGVTVDAVGWEAFFWLTLLAGVPGMLLLQRFSPLGVREPTFTVETGRVLAPLTGAALVTRGVAGGLIGLALGAGSTALLAATRALRATPEFGFDLGGPLLTLLRPADLGDATTTAGVLVFGVVTGLLTAATAAARRGAGRATPDLD